MTVSGYSSRPELAIITWECTIPGPLQGKALTYGHVSEKQEIGKVVEFSEIKIGTKKVRPVIKLNGDDRETLLPLAAAYEESLAAQKEWEVGRKAALKAEYDSKIAELEAQLPAGCILACDHGDSWEGNQSYSFSLGEQKHELKQHDHKIKPTAHFNFAFDGQKVFFAALPESEVRAALGLIAEVETRNAEASNSYQAELLNMEIPAEARAAYDRHRGNAERAWKNEDESAWALINKYSEAIYAQGSSVDAPIYTDPDGRVITICNETVLSRFCVQIKNLNGTWSLYGLDGKPLAEASDWQAIDRVPSGVRRQVETLFNVSI